MNTQSHIYIFEGLDGSGKTTQAELLRERFQQAGKQVHLSSWKGGEFFKEHFATIDTASKKHISPLAHLMLQVADFLYRLEEDIIPFLAEHPEGVVILDRGIETIIARGIQLGLHTDEINTLLLWWEDEKKYTHILHSAQKIHVHTDIDTTLERLVKRSKSEHPEKEFTDGTLLNMHMVEAWGYDPYSGDRLTKKKRLKMVRNTQAMHAEIYANHASLASAITLSGDKKQSVIHDELWQKLT